MPIISYNPLPDFNGSFGAPSSPRNPTPNPEPQVASPKGTDVTSLKEMLLAIGLITRPDAIESNNFLTGVSGWREEVDGDVEFNNGVFRGALIAATIDIGGSDATSFHVDIDGNQWSGGATLATSTFSVTKAGLVTAVSGLIAGWTIAATTISSTGVVLTSGSSASLAFGTTVPTGPALGTGIYMDKTGLFGLSANTQNFKIDATNGNITAIAGAIAGWTFTNTTLSSGSVSINSSLEQMLFGSATAPLVGDGIFLGKSTTYQFRAGSITGSKYMIWDGSVLAIKGPVLTVLGAGSEIGIQGWQFSGVFSASDSDTVAWTSGTVTLLDGTTYAILAGNTGDIVAVTYIYLDIAASTTVLQTTTTAANAVGTGKILLCTAKNVADATKLATFQSFGGATATSGTFITASNIAALTITANEIAANTITAGKMSVSQLSAITADLGAITAGTIVLPSGGYMRSGQTAYDTGTGFYLGNDGGTPKFSLGNSAGDKMTWNGTTLAIVGSLTATTGSIGGFTISATTISSTGLTLTSGASASLAFGTVVPASPTVGTGIYIDKTGLFGLSANTQNFKIDATNGNITSIAGAIGGFTISSTTLANSTNIILDASAKAFSINNATFAQQGIQLQYNGGTPRAYIGDGANQFFEFDGTNVVVNNSPLSNNDVYGDGSDGDVTISVDTTLSRDMFYNNLTVNSGKTLNTGGYRIFVKNTIDGTGVISRNGNNGVAGGNGGNATVGVVGTGGSVGVPGSALADGTLPGSLAGATGGAGRNGTGAGANGVNALNGTNGTAQAKCIIGAGKAGANSGRGGNVNIYTGGTAGTAGTAGANSSSIINGIRSYISAWLLFDQQDGTWYNTSAGNGESPGGASGAGVTGGADQGLSGGGGGGGGSGSSGGVVWVAARIWNFTGTISANGGNGANGGNAGTGNDGAGHGGGFGGSGGGGAGSGANGGLIAMIYSKLVASATTSVTAGTAGTGGTKSVGSTISYAGQSGGDGSNGTAGTAGTVITLVI